MASLTLESVSKEISLLEVSSSTENVSSMSSAADESVFDSTSSAEDESVFNSNEDESILDSKFSTEDESVFDSASSAEENIGSLNVFNSESPLDILALSILECPLYKLMFDYFLN